MTYVWRFWEKHPHQPCFVPKYSEAGALAKYLEMLETLERKNLIKVSRGSTSYRQWIITKPEKFQ